jgi:hypothetical protein
VQDNPKNQVFGAAVRGSLPLKDIQGMDGHIQVIGAGDLLLLLLCIMLLY